MSSTKDYSGLCGIIASFACSSRQIRCMYEFGHGGPCSFEKHRRKFIFYAGSFGNPRYLLEEKDEDGIQQGFKNSVLAHSPFNHSMIFISEEDEVKIR